MPRGRPPSKVRPDNYPSHIDPTKKPEGCYWDKSGSGHWYRFVQDGTTRRRKKVAGASASLQELYNAMARQTDPDHGTLSWLNQKFIESPQHKSLSKKMQESYAYAFRIIARHPTLKANVTLSQTAVSRWTPMLIQKLIDSVAANNGPTAAKKVRDYLRRLFNWGILRELVRDNPAQAKFEMTKERKLQRLPDSAVIGQLQRFAEERGTQAKRAGSCAPYIWYMMVILRKCRLRGIEARTMTDAHLLEEGIYCDRRKGSDDNITEMDALLERAVSAAIEHRNRIWLRKKMPTPLQAKDRHVFVGVSGQPVSVSAWHSAWRRFMNLAIDEEIITREQWFGAHDLKRRGITDTEGTKAEKMLASGHRDSKGIEPYDKSVATVTPAPDK